DVELDPPDAELERPAQARQRVLGRRGGSAPVPDDARQAIGHAARPYWPPSGALAASCRSAPVAWSTTFIDRRTLPRSSMPSTFTFTGSPTLTTSVTLPTRFGASSLMWTRPSREPRKLTKAPKS